MDVTPQLAGLAEQVAALPTNDLVEVLRFGVRKPPIPIPPTMSDPTSSWVAGRPETWDVVGVGYPLSDVMDDLQQGACRRCGLEFEAPAKRAQCPACLASCDLT